MPDENPPKLYDAGRTYREIASQLRELARRCWVKTGRGELVQLATIFEHRAERFDNGWR
jgi:hypothetical protein